MGKRSILGGATPLLLALLGAAFAQPQQTAKQLQELQKRLDEERASWLEFRRNAKTEAERAELVSAFPRDEFVSELEALTKAGPGNEIAARAWYELMRLGAMLDDKELFTRALERLAADHVTSGVIPPLTLDLVYGVPSWSAQPAAAAMRTILAKNTDPTVQANGTAELALLVGLDDVFGPAGKTEAESLLARIEKDYGEKDFIGMTGKEFVTGARNEITKLRVGQIAPDFEVSDQDGVRFKLSDYRGRVVLLDFWGFV